MEKKGLVSSPKVKGQQKTLSHELQRQLKNGSEENPKGQQKNRPKRKSARQLMLKQKSKGKEAVNLGSSQQQLQAESQQQWEPGFIHSPAYQHWKLLGAQQGLSEDCEIACFLLKHYEHASKDLGGVCKTCGTPLSISCTRCDWTICAQAPPTSGRDLTHNEGDGDSTEDDHDLEVKTYGHLGDETARTEGEREATECETQDIELGWNTDSYKEFQETAGQDTVHHSTNIVYGFHATPKTGMTTKVDAMKNDGFMSSLLNLGGNKVTKGTRLSRKTRKQKKTQEKSPRNVFRKILPKIPSHEKEERVDIEHAIKENTGLSTEDLEASHMIFAIHAAESESAVLGHGGEGNSQKYLLLQRQDKSSLRNIVPDVWKNTQDTDFNGSQDGAVDNADPCSLHIQSNARATVEVPLSSPRRQSCSLVKDEDTTTQGAAQSSLLHGPLGKGGHPFNTEEITENDKKCSKDHNYASSSSMSGKAKTPLPSAPTQQVATTKLVKKTDASQTTWTCDKCGKIYRTKRHLKDHRLTHIRKFKCDICDLAFCSSNKVLVHKRKHSDYRPYVCETCGSAFKSLKDLSKHQRSVHEHQKPFSCTVCSKSYFYKYLLKSHMEIHSMSKTERQRARKLRNSHVCEQCGKSFPDYRTLKGHQVVHTGEKPFQCDKCQKRFAHYPSLIKHKRIHTGIKPFECDICHKTFRERGILARHKSSHVRGTLKWDRSQHQESDSQHQESDSQFQESDSQYQESGLETLNL